MMAKIKLKKGISLNDLGKVKHGNYEDPWLNYEFDTVNITDAISLMQVKDMFYVDYGFELKRLTPELIKQYNLKKYFIISTEENK